MVTLVSYPNNGVWFWQWVAKVVRAKILVKNSRSSTPDDGGVLESQRCQQKLNCADLVHRFSFDNNTLLPRVPKQLPVRQPCIVSTFLSKGDIHKQIHADESPLFLAISSASNRWGAINGVVGLLTKLTGGLLVAARLIYQWWGWCCRHTHQDWPHSIAGILDISV